MNLEPSSTLSALPGPGILKCSPSANEPLAYWSPSVSIGPEIRPSVGTCIDASTAAGSTGCAGAACTCTGGPASLFPDVSYIVKTVAATAAAMTAAIFLCVRVRVTFMSLPDLVSDTSDDNYTRSASWSHHGATAASAPRCRDRLRRPR